MYKLPSYQIYMPSCNALAAAKPLFYTVSGIYWTECKNWGKCNIREMDIHREKGTKIKNVKMIH